MKKLKNKIWYPGSSYAPQNWIDYLVHEINGDWTFSDQVKPSWDWTLKSNIRVLTSSTFDLLKNEKFYKDINTLIISFHPGLKTFQEIEETILKKFKPKTIIYVKELFDNKYNIELQNEITMFEHAGYHNKKIVTLPKLKRIYSDLNLR